MIIAGGSDFGKRARLAAINGLVAQSGGWRQLDYSDPINAGLIGYWPFDGGAPAADVSGKGNHWTLANAPTATSGAICSALNFNGTSNAGGINAALVTTFPYSFSAWVKPSGAGSSGIIFGVVRSGDWHFAGIGLNAGAAAVLTVAGSGTDHWDAGGTVATNSWSHIAGVWLSAVNRIVYLNGVQIATGNTSLSPALLDLSKLADIGGIWASNNFHSYFSGSIDEARAYNRALTAAEVYRIYSDTSGNLGMETQPRRLFSFIGGQTIFIDYGGTAEWRAASLTGRSAAIETVAAIIVDRTDPTEWSTASQRDALNGAETLSSARRDQQMPIEATSSSRGDYAVPSETSSIELSNSAQPMEDLSAVYMSRLSTAEVLASLKIDDVLAAETSGLGRSDISSPQEWLASVRTDRSAPAELLASIIRDIGIPIEALSLAQIFSRFGRRIPRALTRRKSSTRE